MVFESFDSVLKSRTLKICFPSAKWVGWLKAARSEGDLRIGPRSRESLGSVHPTPIRVLVEQRKKSGPKIGGLEGQRRIIAACESKFSIEVMEVSFA